MLKTRIIHPQLMRALAEAGFGSRILVADANYPIASKSNPAARKIFLNFIPGLVGTRDIIRTLAETVVIDSAIYLAAPDNKMPEIVAEYQKIIGADIPFSGLERFDFYDTAAGPDTAVIIASGECTRRSNLLMTIGVVPN
jgi:L-fucose mutarotase